MDFLQDWGGNVIMDVGTNHRRVVVEGSSSHEGLWLQSGESCGIVRLCSDSSNRVVWLLLCSNGGMEAMGPCCGTAASGCVVLATRFGGCEEVSAMKSC